MATMSIEAAEKRLAAARNRVIKWAKCVDDPGKAKLKVTPKEGPEAACVAMLKWSVLLLEDAEGQMRRAAKKLKTELDVERMSKASKGRKVKRARKA